MYTLRVWGDLACFTRPEMKVERVSYGVMTPSAARGILEAIYWKPQFRWVIDRIHVLKPIQFIPIVRNELANPSRLQGNILSQLPTTALRSSLVLTNVEYYIQAHIELQPENDDGMHGPNTISKHHTCFIDRASVGAFFKKPYFGCREFFADFELMPKNAVLKPSLIKESIVDCGLVFKDFDYPKYPLRDPHVPKFFHATMYNGIITVK